MDLSRGKGGEIVVIGGKLACQKDAVVQGAAGRHLVRTVVLDVGGQRTGM
jgi:hypothetical protein